MYPSRIFDKLIIVVCIVTILLMNTSASLQAQEDSGNLTFDELVLKITAAERKLLNIRIESEVFEEKRDSPSDPWKRNGVYVSSTAWYNGLPKSKARVDIHDETLRWAGSEAPFSKASYSVSFDGQTGRIVKYGIGTPDEMHEQKRAEILPTAPSKLRDKWRDLTTGAAFSLNFLYNEQGVAFSEILKSMKAIGTQLDISEEKYQGANCIKISIDTKHSTEAYWLDTEHGFAFRGNESARIEKDGRKRVFLCDVVNKIAEVGPGVWYPMEAYRHYSPPDANRPENRVMYRASKVIANDPSFDEKVFRVPIPSGHLVQDKTLGMGYQAGGNPKVLEEQLNNIVMDILSDNTAHPVVNTVDNKQPIDAIESSSTPLIEGMESIDPEAKKSSTSKQPGSGAKSHIHILAVASGLVFSVLLITIIYFVFLKKRKNSIQNVCLLLGFTLICGFAVQTSPNPAFASKESAENHFNCGLNIAYITLRCLGSWPSLNELAKNLKAGGGFSRQVSMLDLRNTFEEYGLKAHGFKADTIEEILGFADAHNVLIVQTRIELDEKTIDHYIAIRNQGNHVCLINPPEPVGRFSKQQIIKKLPESRPTGNFMVVTKPRGAIHIGPSINIENTNINLGKITVSTRKITGTIKYSNKGSKTLKVIDVHGPCTCYNGYSGDTELQPGESGELKVTFLKEKLPHGYLRRHVKIATNDPKNEVVSVCFSFFSQGKPDVNDVRLVPQVIDFGRASVKKISEQKTLIKLYIPREKQTDIDRIEVKVVNIPSLKVNLIDDTHQSDRFIPTPNKLYQLVTYVISWKTPPENGVFKGEIHFIIHHKENDETIIEVTIRGDALVVSRIFHIQEKSYVKEARIWVHFAGIRSV